MFNSCDYLRISAIPNRVRSLGAIPLVFALAAGCSSKDSPTGAGAGGSGSSGGSGNSGGADSGAPPAKIAPVGVFTVRLVAAVVNTTDPSLNTAAYTSFNGTVRDATVNQNVVWDYKQGASGCQLFKARIPFCNTDCATGSTCVEDETCRPNPTPRSVGEVTVTGLNLADNTSQFNASPTTPNYSYTSSVSILYPPANEGAAIRLTAAGGVYAPFVLEAKGIMPLELTGSDKIPMQDGAALPLRWAPKGATGDSRIEVLVNINHHGGSPGNIVCDVEDSGSLDIPAPLVTGLMNLGYSGFPNVEVARKSVGVATIDPGRVELQIVSNAIREISISGLTSCNEDTDCVAPQTCLATKQCG